jgi:large subunit ribosomal protein L32
MAVQQHRVSRQKCRSRKAANRLKPVQTNNCEKCNEPIRPHRVCTACGYYKGRKILDVE